MRLDYSMDTSEWSNWMREGARRSGDLVPAHEKIGDFLVGESKDNFETSGGLEQWKALKPATLARRARQYPSAGIKPLIVTRELYNSMTKAVESAYVDVGSALLKARTLFFGRDNIPARSPFNWRGGVLDRVGQLYLDHLFGGAR